MGTGSAVYVWNLFINKGELVIVAKVIMICGRLCSGKSKYAEQLRLEYNAVVLSADENMLVLFDRQAGEKHDEYVKKIKEFLYKYSRKRKEKVGIATGRKEKISVEKLRKGISET